MGAVPLRDAATGEPAVADGNATFVFAVAPARWAGAVTPGITSMGRIGEAADRTGLASAGWVAPPWPVRPGTATEVGEAAEAAGLVAGWDV